MRATLQAAFVLHSRPLNETSLILDVFTAAYGRVSLLAKGVRTSSRARFRGLLRPFVPLVVSWSGKTELMSLTAVEAAGASLELVGSALLSGIYVNELLVRVLPKFDPCPQIFRAYQQMLIDVQHAASRESGLRIFEKELLVGLGYGFSLDRETGNGRPIVSENYYQFVPGRGLSQCLASHQGHVVFSGKSILALYHGKLEEAADLRAAKHLTRLAIAALLGDKVLRSREFFYQGSAPAKGVVE